MLQRLLFGLITVTSLTLVGCAHSPQQLSPEPKLTAQLAPVGHGQPVVVRVVDGRPSPTLGTRGGLYPETSAITVQGARSCRSCKPRLKPPCVCWALPRRPTP